MFLRELSPIDKIQLNLLSAHGCGNDGEISIDNIGLCGATPYYFQLDRWSCGYRNMQMILGNLYILQNIIIGHEPIGAVAVTVVLLREKTFQLTFERKSERRCLLSEGRCQLSGANISLLPSVRNLQGRFEFNLHVISL